MSDIWERIKNKVSEIVKSRVFIVIIIFCVTSAILVQRVFYLQIVKGQEYFDNYKLQIQKTKEVEGTRGNIYDRNGKLLAYNELAYSVTIEDNGEYDTKKQKNKELNKIVTKVIDIVEKNNDTVINDFGIILDKDNNYIFVAESKTQRLRFIADVYGKKTIDELTKTQKNQTAEEIIDYLCTDQVYGYGIDQKKTEKEDVLKLVNVRYAISLNSYQKYIATTIAKDVSEETVADIMENMDSLQGVDIQEESFRRYNNSKCFANIIGYTGQISVEEYDALSKEEKEEYDKTDTVGKAGLEKTMDSTLKGTKGEVKLYVNNVGKIIETVEVSKPKAGNDLYLSIDADLQVAAYNILEQVSLVSSKAAVEVLGQYGYAVHLGTLLLLHIQEEVLLVHTIAYKLDGTFLDIHSIGDDHIHLYGGHYIVLILEVHIHHGFASRKNVDVIYDNLILGPSACAEAKGCHQSGSTCLQASYLFLVVVFHILTDDYRCR